MSLVPKNSYFDDTFENFLSLKENSLKCDIYEKDGIYHIEVEAPGFKKEDVTIDFDDGYITIEAKKDVSKDEEKKNYIRKERYSKEYSRQFYIGDVDESKIKAKYENGLLHIEVPKKQGKINKKSIKID